MLTLHKTVVPCQHGKHGNRIVVLEADDLTTVKAVTGCERKHNYRILYTETLLYPYSDSALEKAVDRAKGVFK